MSYQHLSEKERYVISHLQYSFSIREIARRLGRHHSTISREFKRAKARHPWTIYYYDWSHPLALERRQKPRHLRRRNNQRLVAYVESKIRLEWSPEEIANRIRMDYPDDDQMRISHETIYRWTYLDSSAGGTLYQSLRRNRKKRRKQRRYDASSAGTAQDAVSWPIGSALTSGQKLSQNRGQTTFCVAKKVKDMYNCAHAKTTSHHHTRCSPSCDPKGK